MKTGLTSEEVLELQKKYGKNVLVTEKKENFLKKIFHIICEPMFLLLIIAATIYFILGEAKDGIVMLVFVVGIISLDIIQEWKTDKTLKALKDLSEPKIKVLRDNQEQIISSSELVVGDLMFIYEGIKIPADGRLLKCSGLKVDESILTGESMAIYKSLKDSEDGNYKNNFVYQGTMVINGTGLVEVVNTGVNTEYGKIGLNISKVKHEKTKLQKECDKLIKVCAFVAIILFLLVFIITFFSYENLTLSDRLIKSILSGVTLAMAMIPEEFPVVLTVFLSMGAWRLAKKNSLVKNLSSVEALGTISVLCVDKTGTITKNEMTVEKLFFEKDETSLLKNMCLASEEDTFDAMEKAMFKYAYKKEIYKKDLFVNKKIKEYPFSDETKMMGNAYLIDNTKYVAIKGAYESIVKLCELTKKDLNKLDKEVLQMQSEGLRVIAVASKKLDKEQSIDSLDDIVLEFSGIVGLIDPPKEGILQDVKICNDASIRIIMITGDNGITASSIAKSIGINNYDKVITGKQLQKMSFNKLKKCVNTTSVFSRVMPEDKKKIVEALQANGEIVAMTGDGVNDAIALKKADIGIAMGKRGNDVARESADLILLDDNFHTIVETIEDGRKIYENIRKAIAYILIIHVPIALGSLIAPLLNIPQEAYLFLPIQIMLMELIIDPTSSVVLERQPKEKNIMTTYKRKSLVDLNIVIKSMIQGLVMFMFCFIPYIYLLKENVLLARTIGILVLMFGNIFIVQVNSSNESFAYESLKKLVKDKVFLLINLIMILAFIIIIYSPLNSFLKLSSLSLVQLFICVLLAFMSTYWYELVKLIKKIKKH